MQRDAPVSDILVSEALHGPGKSNGCCLDCCGAPPKAIDPVMIEKDGGKWLRLSDGRILEYFIYGSTNEDAKVLMQISGTAGTARTFTLGGIDAKMKELNIRGIGVTVPGHAYSTVNVGRKISEFGKDVEEVLKAEGLTAKKFWVEGTSYGTSHAMAIAHYMKDSVAEFPDEAKYQYQDIKRSAKHSVYGLVFNASEDHVFDWGFDPREITLKGESQVLVSYAEDDQESPPEQGMWIVKHFSASANPGRGKGHDSFSIAMRKGEQVQLFHDLCISRN